jgi:hypothetical protein
MNKPKCETCIYFYTNGRESALASHLLCCNSEGPFRGQRIECDMFCHNHQDWEIWFAEQTEEK